MTATVVTLTAASDEFVPVCTTDPERWTTSPDDEAKALCRACPLRWRCAREAWETRQRAFASSSGLVVHRSGSVVQTWTNSSDAAVSVTTVAVIACIPPVAMRVHRCCYDFRVSAAAMQRLKRSTAAKDSRECRVGPALVPLTCLNDRPQCYGGQAKGLVRPPKRSVKCDESTPKAKREPTRVGAHFPAKT